MATGFQVNNPEVNKTLDRRTRSAGNRMFQYDCPWHAPRHQSALRYAATRASMFMIIWTKELETGSAELDQQHELLIDNSNLLEEQLQTPNRTQQEAESAVRLVDYLEAYTNAHFKDEEHCMERYRCPAHTQNQQEHERCRGFIPNYKRLCEIEGFKVELLRNLHEVFRLWVEEHILKIDTQLKPCIQK